MKRVALHYQILIALVLGTILGVLVNPGEVELDGRITGVLFQDEFQENLQGAGFGYQLGVRYFVDDRATLQMMVEQNFNAIHTNQFRVFAVADLDLWM